MRITRTQLRSLIREDLQGFLDKTANIEYTGHMQDPTFDADWQQILPNKQQARKVKQIWAAEADHDFMNSIVKVHWIKPEGSLKGILDRFLGMSRKNEISTMGYPPGTETFKSTWGPIGVVVQGRTTLAANSMSSLYSGFTGDITPEMMDKYKQSGVPKRATTFSGSSDPSSVASDYILDKKSFNPRMVGSNEFIVDNWKPIGIVLAPNIRDALFKQSMGEETKYVSPADAEEIVSSVEFSGLPIYSVLDEDEINLWRDRVRGQQSAGASQPEQTVTEALLRRIVRATLLAESNGAPLYTGIVLSETGVAQLREKIYELDLIKQIPGWLTSKPASHGNEQLNHHMTLSMGALKPNNPLRDALDTPVPLRVVGWGVSNDLGVAAWQVVPPEGFPVSTGNPHITGALATPDVRPFAAAKITSWEPLAEPFMIVGTLAEVYPVETR